MPSKKRKKSAARRGGRGGQPKLVLPDDVPGDGDMPQEESGVKATRSERPEEVRRVSPMIPLSDLCLLIHEAVPETTPGGVLLPEHIRRRRAGLQMGIDPSEDEMNSIPTPEWDVMTVIAIGPGRRNPAYKVDEDDPEDEYLPFPDGIEVGARVVVKAGSSGTPRFMWEDEVYCLTPANGILGVMKSDVKLRQEVAAAEIQASMRMEAEAGSGGRSPLIAT